MNLVSKSRKAFSATVVAATIAWSMGASTLTAAAATPATGSLIKASLPTVYYLGADSKRYVFPNQDTYKTWYADFSSVQTITDAELAALPLGGNVTMRPGVAMVKITTDPKVYAVSKNGVLRWIKTEAAAQALYGSDWAKKVKDVADSFFTNYTIGSDIASSADFLPATEMSNSASINVDKGLSTSTSTTTTVSGTMTATLSATQPVGGTTPKNATGISMVKVDVRNGGSTSVTIDSLGIRRTGVGSNADFGSLYVYEGASRLTTGRTMTSNNEVSFGGLSVALGAGETKTLTIVADMDAESSGNENAIQVTSIGVGSTVAAGLPVTGPTFRTSGSEAAKLTVTANGTFSAAEAGTTAKVAQFEVKNSTTPEDVVLSKVALKYDGSTSSSNLTNLTLKQGGTTVATVKAIGAKDLATFVLSSPMTITKGGSRVFEVYADIGATVRAADDIEFYVENASDVYAVGSTYGYGAAVDNRDYAGDGKTEITGVGSLVADRNVVSIKAGKIVVTFNGPAAKDVAVDSNDVEIFNFTLTSQSNVEVKKVKFDLISTVAGIDGTADGLIDSSASTKVANYTDIRLIDTATGAQLGSTELNLEGGDSSQTVSFGDSFYISAGQSRTIKLVVDVADNANLALNGSYDVEDSLVAKLIAFSGSDFRNLDNDKSLETSDIKSNGATGNTMTITSSTLSVYAASTPVAQTYIKGTQGAAIGALVLKAGDTSALKVSDITLKPVDVDVDLDKYDDVISSASLWNGSTQVGELESPDASNGNLVFTDLNLTIPAGQSTTLTLKANLANGETTGRIEYSVTGSDVRATDLDGATKTVEGAQSNFKTMTISVQGNVTVALAADDAESESGLVVGGSTNVVLAKYKFSSTKEELRLSKVRMSIGASNTDAVTSLSLYDGSSLVGGPMSIDSFGNADFTGVNFVVPKDGSKTLIVKANLNSVGNSGAVTGRDVTIKLDCNDAFKVEGTSSSTSLTSVSCPSNELVANQKVVYKTKPTISLSTLPNTTLSAGDQTVMRFTITADAAGEVAFNQIAVNITPSTVAGSGMSIGLPANGANRVLRRMGGDYINADVTNVSGNRWVIALGSAKEETIAAGTSKTYDIIMGVGSPVANDSVSSYLVDDTSKSNGTRASLVSGNSFVWSDEAGDADGSHSFTTADWANGFKVKNLPTDSQTMSK